MTELTDTERETLPEGCICAEVAAIVGNHLDDDQIKAICDLHTNDLTARLARVEALADEWESGLCWPGCDCEGCYALAEASSMLRAALAAPTPTEVQP